MDQPFIRNSLALLLAVFLTACGGGGGGGGGGSSSPPPTQPDNATDRTVQLSWTAPTTREDNSPLRMSELSGYRLYYFLDDSNQEQDRVLDIAGGTTTRTEITLPGPGTYFIAVTAVDSAGLVSRLSNYVTVTTR